jgi:hypothetical protein
MEVNFVKYLTNLIIPMFGAASKAISSSLKQPILILLGIEVPDGQLDNSDFIRWEDTLTEGVLAIALFEGAALFDHHANDEP